jgi:UDP-N-acetyl-D-mannosaminuronate dehydrogenase
LTKETILLIGLGEIGHTLFSVYSEKKESFQVYGIDIDEAKMKALQQDKSKIPVKLDVFQICMPCGNPDKFAQIIADYALQYKPKLIIVNSTVPPGTTIKVAEKCICPVVHSPARGVHITDEHMVWEMKRWPKYVGGATSNAEDLAKAHFKKLGLKVKVLKSCRETELAKLFETTYRALMIAGFQEMHRIARANGADFNDTVDFLEDTHRQRLDRPIMFPGFIGGHCLIPNTKLLLNSYNSDILRFIIESNEKRSQEMENPEIKTEAEKVSARAEKLQKDLTGDKNLVLPQNRGKTRPDCV